MGPRSTAVLCTRVVSWVEPGLRKAAIASSVGGFRAGAALGIEPVISSVAGGCLPLVTFRSPKTPNTRMASPATPSRVRWLRVNLGMAKRSRTIEDPNPRRRPFCCGNGNFTVPVLTVCLEIGSRARKFYKGGLFLNTARSSRQASPSTVARVKGLVRGRHPPDATKGRWRSSCRGPSISACRRARSGKSTTGSCRRRAWLASFAKAAGSLPSNST